MTLNFSGEVYNYDARLFPIYVRLLHFIGWQH